MAEQGGRAAGERPARAAARAVDRRRDPQRRDAGGPAREAARHGVRRAAGEPVVRGLGRALLTRDEPLLPVAAVLGSRASGSLPPLASLRRPRAGHRRAAPAGASRRSAGAGRGRGLDHDQGGAARSRDARRRGLALRAHPRRSRGGGARMPAGAGRAGGQPARRSGRRRPARPGSSSAPTSGTAHVYNEISAHAAGATHFDADVDTIFEIGGQDAKYILLRNGVPIDYAMNNACSAGTGSFLEESAQGDLGLAVADIADIALAAPAPCISRRPARRSSTPTSASPSSKATPAKTSPPGWCTRSPATTSPTVKGPRAVGRKVFLQGGVALNRAVGHAFAQSVGRPVVIPPHPELLGALGVALLALDRGDAGCSRRPRTAACPDRPHRGQLQRHRRAHQRRRRRSARARGSRDEAGQPFHVPGVQAVLQHRPFEVAGPAFPFGGRCSLFENVWKRRARTAAAPDLVEQRAGVLFDAVHKKIAARPPGPAAEPTATAESGRTDAGFGEGVHRGRVRTSERRRARAGAGPGPHRHSAGADDPFALPALRDLLLGAGDGGGAVRRGSAGRVEGQFGLLLSRCRSPTGRCWTSHGTDWN